uniref:Vanillate O-demethylase oxygenase subunit n=1 Tax=Sphingomonas sp. JE1 TaxID=1628059 RepID=A0A0D5A0A7_9SPHN|nr:MULTISPECIES: aromatic ring-hydroxylating dioxygenase subunit alpha [unclassified Sphingomonas]AJW29591.1 Vanillate O-demethylase oxygenase subunit [Sphingomonas sp. JE1]
MNFLKNAWYAAGWPDELNDGKLVGRRFLNEPVVMFRKSDGTVAAMGDRCPHRFAPLHLGRHVGDGVQCGYHGLEFGADGRCMRNPHGGGTLPNASVPTYPLAEKHGVLWIWMGDATKADESLISDSFAFVADEKRAHIKGYLHIEANYMLLVDNLMDLSHGLYLHAGSLSNRDMQDNFELKTRVEGDVISSEREQPNIEPPAIWVPALPPEAARIDYFSYNEWQKPSNVIHPVGCRRVGKPEGVDGGVSSRSAHMFTPETDTSSHYFYSNSRDYGVDSQEADARIRKMLATAFGGEDKPMIEAQQKMVGNVDLMALRPVILPSDKPAVMVRRRLAQLIAEEQRNASSEAA